MSKYGRSPTGKHSVIGTGASPFFTIPQGKNNPHSANWQKRTLHGSVNWHDETTARPA